MKMVLAIINYDDAQDVISSLMKAGFSITKLATTGGFLKAGNVTILVGLDESLPPPASRSSRRPPSWVWAFSRPPRFRSMSAARPYSCSASSALRSCDLL